MTTRALAALAVSLMIPFVAPVAARGATTGAASSPVAVQPVTVDLGPGADAGSGLAVQPDGKIVVVGTANRLQSGGSDMAVLRFGADGRLDPTFGDAGKVLVDNGAREQASAVAIQPDGMIVVVGSATAGNTLQAAVTRVDPAGRLDPTFNGGKMVVLPFVNLADSAANAVTLQPDGKILVAGRGTIPGAGEGQAAGFLLMRLTSTGAMDRSFGDGSFGDGSVGNEGGVTLVEMGGFDEALFVVRRPDGRIVLAGNAMGGATFSGPPVTTEVLMQFSAVGKLDTTFGKAGMVTNPANMTMSGAVLRPDGTVVAAGWANVDPYSGAEGRSVSVSAYGVDGSPDSRFGAGGSTVTHTPPAVSPIGSGVQGGAGAAAIALDGRGRLVVAGTTEGVNNADLGVVRYSGTGKLDASFGRAGWIRTDVAGGDDRLTAVGMLPNGAIVGAGTSDDKVLLVVYPSSDQPSAETAWGWNPLGQLGDGTAVDRHAPTVVKGLSGAAILSGGVLHSLAVDDGGTAYAWGWNGVGALGDGTTVDHSQPTPVPGLSGVADVAAGYYHSLAVVGGTVKAWGWNAIGQLGDGTTVDRHAPVSVPGLGNIVAVAAGALHSLALRSDGTVWAWGWNGVGQLGDGTTVDRYQPVRVLGLHNVIAIAAGAYHSVALTSDGLLWTWGWNAVNQLGDGTTTDSHQPVNIGNTLGIVAVAAGGLHTLALREDGRVFAWGYNGYGELGDGSTVNATHPALLPGLTQVNNISAGLLHSAAVTADHHVWAWGWNGVGQVGDGTTVDRHVPVLTAGPAIGRALGTGAFHTFVVGQ